ncbi:DEAD-box ATP-dependent RNA helicase 35 [Haplosporangium sp. Z 767]|nr:DEAD-box ATP-dependent RNA helicase 35 [Haplosporangium sp. Z 11]KAF9194024.1 DEAD-box ATP-dependent RNA helicase 35 [Haplosporangium sp. Z 767]
MTASFDLILAQEEREYAINAFKSYQKDVLVATDVASKGLDFAEIHHVILFDMPKEIEDYVHRIGRTGRSGKTGIATTFINMNSSEQRITKRLTCPKCGYSVLRGCKKSVLVQ